MVKSQVSGFKSGNQMAAAAAGDINYHIMGYYPISPSTEVAQILDMDGANGKHDVQLIAADGEHSAAGICYGAATTGARVFNATSANGLMYMLEQLPVQSGTRFPMVMNLVNRSVSGPLNIHCDHSDMYFALNSGWVMLAAANPQAVYDLNIIALKVAEHAAVRLPVMLNYDGYITSHQKHNVNTFAKAQDVREFVGEPVREGYHFIADSKSGAISVGAHMAGNELINNHYQVHLAHEHVIDVYKEVATEYEKISGRKYEVIETYGAEDADVVLFILNSSADTAKDAVDFLASEGKKVKVIRPNVIRPFPAAELVAAIGDAKVVIAMDRADSAGASGGNISHDLKSALLDAKNTQTTVISRVYGLGGKEFFVHDAINLFTMGYDCLDGKDIKLFDYYGVTPGNKDLTNKQIHRQMESIKPTAYKSGKIKTTWNEEKGQVDVRVPALRNLTTKPNRLTSGHGACPGCGIFPGLELFFKGIEGDIVLINQTGCGYVVSAGYPYTAHQQHYIHNLFQSGAATLSGVVEAAHKLRSRGELEFDDDATFVMMTGDGGMDIGMGSAIGAALRRHKLIIIEYDNQGYMNTGAQMSYSTPIGNRTSTTNIGAKRVGKLYHHKDTPQIMAACNVPYVFTGSESYPLDLVKKGAKAHWYAKNVGPVYGKILIACPLNWKSADKDGTTVVKAAVDCGFFPLYEVENGKTTITVDAKGEKLAPVEDWLKYMGKTRHLLQPENEEILADMKSEIKRRYNQLRAKHEHPEL
jgi:Pyruvate:ferredoxin oxidoreductase and related 2-oxoacid:ferredoxin oxidoreductases, alpha subunit